MRKAITSASNPTLKLARGLNRVGSLRKETGLCLVESQRGLQAALASAAELVHVLVAPDLVRDAAPLELVARLEAQGVDILEVPPKLFESLSRQENPRGLAGVVKQRWEALASVAPQSDDLWVALDDVRDPGNLGTIIRTCQAVGAAGVLLIGESTDPYHPIALRAGTGATFHQRLVRTTFDRFAAWKAEHGCAVVGTSPRAQQDYREVRYPRPMVLLMGSEHAGLSGGEQSVCDLLVGIPMGGETESLNLSVAAGVILYEIFAQRWAEQDDSAS